MAIDDDDLGGEDTSEFPYNIEYMEKYAATFVVYSLNYLVDYAGEALADSDSHWKKYIYDTATKEELIGLKKVLGENIPMNKIIDLALKEKPLRSILADALYEINHIINSEDEDDEDLGT